MAPHANLIVSPRAMPASPLLARLLATLDIAALTRAANGTFTLLGEAPDWLKGLWPDLAHRRSGLHPGTSFLFLSYFLEEAEAFWATGRDGRLASGPWTEVDAGGREWMLEAVALRVDGTPLLLIQSPTVDLQTYRHLLQASREQALALSQLQKEIDRREVMLHCIVHDLSNPLAGLKGSLRLLREDGAVPGDARELLDIGLRQVEKLQGLVRETLREVTPPAAPHPPGSSARDAPPDAAACAREVAAALGAAAALKSVKLYVELEAKAEAASWKVVGDAGRLERVLFNLVENALRHAPDGSAVAVRLRHADPFVYCRVEDQGPGAAPEVAERLFEKYARGGAAAGQAGLGLYFCRITVEGWGGQIGYEPAESGGACFWFRLPMPSPD